jgi:hypothetical protein
VRVAHDLQCHTAGKSQASRTSHLHHIDAWFDGMQQVQSSRRPYCSPRVRWQGRACFG